MIKVVGIAFGTSELRKEARIESSVKIGYEILKRWAKASAEDMLSRVSIPAN